MKRPKQSIRMLGSKNPMYGKTHSEDARKKISIANTGRKLSKKHILALIKANTGRKKSSEEKDKIRKAKLGVPRPAFIKKILRDLGIKRIREKNPAWNGGQIITPRGRCRTSTRKIYIGKKRYIQEHILVMEKHLGRKLKRDGRKGEVVHHLNGDGLDNRIENLRLFSSNSEHVKEEQKLNYFAKKILFGNLIPHLKKELNNVYKKLQSVVTKCITVVSTKWVNSQNGGSDTQWFLIDSLFSPFIFYERQGVKSRVYVDDRNKNTVYDMSARWQVGWKNWRGVWGSKGDASAYSA